MHKLVNPTLSSCKKRLNSYGFLFFRSSPWLYLFDQPPVTGWSKRHNHGDLGLLGQDNQITPNTNLTK